MQWQTTTTASLTMIIKDSNIYHWKTASIRHRFIYESCFHSTEKRSAASDKTL
jgi:hypothetical protein